jgi:hypothetical protein
MTLDPSQIARLLDSLERIAKANEELIRLAVEEREEVPAEPLACPNCQKRNPRVRGTGGEGPLSEFVLIATCQECGHRLVAVPRGMDVTTPEQIGVN